MKLPTFAQFASTFSGLRLKQLRKRNNESVRISRRLRTRRLQVFEQLEGRSVMAAGDLDLTFGTGGKVVTNFGPGSTSDEVRYDGSMALQADGKILLSGVSGGNFALARYNTNGTLDTSFDGDGKVTTDFGSAGDFGYAVAVQSDGKIVVAGSNNIQIALARYNSNGSLDTSFDGDGKLTTQAGTSFSEAYTIAVQADGKILAAGTADDASGNFIFAVVRYNSNGTLDTGFDGDGKAFATLGSGGNDLAHSIALQADGKILLVGESFSTTSDFGVARFNTNGSLDTSFSGDGKLTTTFGTGTEIAYSVAVQADAKIVVGGLARPGSDDDFGLVRYNTDGSLDTSFDGDGKVTTSFGVFNDYAHSVVVQADGKIVAAGVASITIPNGDFALARYNTNGSLDATFGTSGKVTTPVQAGFDTGYSLAIQSDGKFVVGGSSTGLSFDFALVRYQGDPAFSATANLSVTTQGNETGPVAIVYTVTLSAANTTGSAITFDLDDLGTGTAISGTDYTAIAGNALISVANGASTGTLTVLVTDDSLLETTETVIAQISNSSNAGATIGTASATANITDNDTATANLSVTTHGNETGPVNIVYTVTLSKTNNTGTAITFDLDDLGTGTANSGSDYTAIAGNAVISVANGASTGTLTVLVTDDADVEATETVTAQISNSSNAAVTIGTASATANITDNDVANQPPTAVTLTPSSASIAENASTARATLLSTISVTDDGQGTNVLSLTGADASSFEIVGNDLRLKAGVALDFETKPTYTVTVEVDDASVGGAPDASATFTLNLTNVNEAPTAVTLTPSSASLAENASTSSATQLSTISVTDDGLGTNVLSLTGPDTASFEIVGNSLRLKAGVVLDFETKPTYTVIVNVDDASVGAAPDASATFILNLTNSSELTGIDVQKGQTQRSYVRYLDILFDVGGSDLLDLIANNRLQLTKFDLNGNNGAVQAMPTRTAVGNQIQLDFGSQGIGGNRNTNVGDGYFEIAVDMDGNGTFETKKNFHRLLGDVTGNGIVDATDKSQVLAAQGMPYIAENDVNGDGILNITDTTLVTRAFGRRLRI